MKTFRVIELGDVKPEDFYDLPFWVNAKGGQIWVSMQHHLTTEQMHSYVGLQWVKNNIAQPAFKVAPDNNTRELYETLRWQHKLAMPYVPTMGRSSKSNKRICECEVHLGEPCYCYLN